MTVHVTGFGGIDVALKSTTDGAAEVPHHRVDGEVATRPVAVTTIGFSLTASTGGVALPAQASRSVIIQNRRTANDGTTSQDNYIWVIIGGVKMYELAPGGSVTVQVVDASLISLMTFTGTNLVSGGIEP